MVDCNAVSMEQHSRRMESTRRKGAQSRLDKRGGLDFKRQGFISQSLYSMDEYGGGQRAGPGPGLSAQHALLLQGLIQDTDLQFKQYLGHEQPPQPQMQPRGQVLNDAMLHQNEMYGGSLGHSRSREQLHINRMNEFGYNEPDQLLAETYPNPMLAREFTNYGRQSNGSLSRNDPLISSMNQEGNYRKKRGHQRAASQNINTTNLAKAFMFNPDLNILDMAAKAVDPPNNHPSDAGRRCTKSRESRQKKLSSKSLSEWATDQDLLESAESTKRIRTKSLHDSHGDHDYRDKLSKPSVMDSMVDIVYINNKPFRILARDPNTSPEEIITGKHITMANMPDVVPKPMHQGKRKSKRNPLQSYSMDSFMHSTTQDSTREVKGIGTPKGTQMINDNDVYQRTKQASVRGRSNRQNGRDSVNVNLSNDSGAFSYIAPDNDGMVDDSSDIVTHMPYSVNRLDRGHTVTHVSHLQFPDDGSKRSTEIYDHHLSKEFGSNKESHSFSGDSETAFIDDSQGNYATVAQSNTMINYIDTPASNESDIPLSYTNSHVKNSSYMKSTEASYDQYSHKNVSPKDIDPNRIDDGLGPQIRSRPKSSKLRTRRHASDSFSEMLQSAEMYNKEELSLDLGDLQDEDKERDRQVEKKSARKRTDSMNGYGNATMPPNTPEYSPATRMLARRAVLGQKLEMKDDSDVDGEIEILDLDVIENMSPEVSPRLQPINRVETQQQEAIKPEPPKPRPQLRKQIAMVDESEESGLDSRPHTPRLTEREVCDMRLEKMHSIKKLNKNTGLTEQVREESEDRSKKLRSKQKNRSSMVEKSTDENRPERIYTEVGGKVLDKYRKRAKSDVIPVAKLRELNKQEVENSAQSTANNSHFPRKLRPILGKTNSVDQAYGRKDIDETVVTVDADAKRLPNLGKVLPERRSRQRSKTRESRTVSQLGSNPQNKLAYKSEQGLSLTTSDVDSQGESEGDLEKESERLEREIAKLRGWTQVKTPRGTQDERNFMNMDKFFRSDPTKEHSELSKEYVKEHVRSSRAKSRANLAEAQEELIDPLFARELPRDRQNSKSRDRQRRKKTVTNM